MEVAAVGSSIPSTSKDDLSSPFPKLPKEIRLKIWRSTWEPRVVNIIRKSKERKVQCDTNADNGSDEVVHNKLEIPRQDAPDTASNTDSDSTDREELETRHYCAVMLDWGEEALTVEEDDLEYSARLKDVKPMDRYLLNTTTFSWATTPTSLWVNHEAREETLRHFELCWGLDGGESRVWFNFDLDVLLVDGLEDHLMITYHQRDLVRLQRAMIWVPPKPHSSEAPYESPDHFTKFSSTMENFCSKGIRTGASRSIAEAYDFTAEWRNVEILWTTQLKPDYTLTGAKLRYPEIREIYFVHDQPLVDLPHPTEIDVNTLPPEDVRFHCVLDECLELRRWDENHFTERSDIGTVVCRKDLWRKAAEYCRHLRGGLENPGPQAPKLPGSWTVPWSTIKVSSRFVSKIAVSSGKEREINVSPGFKKLESCDVAPRCGGPNGGRFSDRFLSDPCVEVQYWNEMSSWISGILWQSLLVGDGFGTIWNEFPDPSMCRRLYCRTFWS